MAYKVFRKIEGGREMQHGKENRERKIILTAKQNSYFNSRLPSGRGELASAGATQGLGLASGGVACPHLLFDQVTSKGATWLHGQGQSLIQDANTGTANRHLLKNLPAMWETQVRSLGQEDPLEKRKATHSSILAWEIPWIEQPGGLQSMGSQESD